MEHAIYKLRVLDKSEIKIAYFSMEIGFDENIPTYSGGLGILAGDTLRSCADLGVPILGITLLSNKGYFIQKINENNEQIELAEDWDYEKYLEPVKESIYVKIGKRTVYIYAWKYNLKGVGGHSVPIYFLDTDVEENHEEDRKITHHLYGGDKAYRLCQEIVLGIGGYRLLKILGYYDINKYHMNEGHSALLTIELRKDLVDQTNWDMFDEEIDQKVPPHCVFTTHTPVPAGHDKFTKDLVTEKLSDYLTPYELDELCENDELNMTLLALKNSKYVNGVAKKHGEISREMFPGYDIDSITNGIHPGFWSSEHFCMLFDKYLKEWRADSFTLRTIFNIPPDEIWDTHQKCKKDLVDLVKKSTGRELDCNKFTIGFARRMTAYKRPLFIFSDIERIMGIAKKFPIQFVFAGKSHPLDTEGKKIVKLLNEKIKEYGEKIDVVFLENYNISMAKILIPGVDVWLNNPQPPKEASGTSGMKASVNGVPNLSVLDGWWLEGHVENVTGWSIGERDTLYTDGFHSEKDEIETLYDKLENNILKIFYEDRNKWKWIMQNTIAFNGSFFNTHRMVYQYVLSAYFD